MGFEVYVSVIWIYNCFIAHLIYSSWERKMKEMYVKVLIFMCFGFWELKKWEIHSLIDSFLFGWSITWLLGYLFLIYFLILDLGTGFGIWSWSVWHGSEFLVGFQSNLKCVPDWFTSLPNCDYKMGRVMLMPFWWKFWSWVVVKKAEYRVTCNGCALHSRVSGVYGAKLCLSSILDWVVFR